VHGLVQVAEEVQQPHGRVAAVDGRALRVEQDGGLVHDGGDDAVGGDAVERVVEHADVLVGVVALGVDEVPVLGPRHVFAAADGVGPGGGVADVEGRVEADERAEGGVGRGGEVFLCDVPHCLVAEAVPAQRGGGREEGECE